jgi:ABC-type uncharacterized transport system involved in gliding motility auxiliary subunit
LALSFFPGARPLEIVQAAGVKLTQLAASSSEAYIIANRLENGFNPPPSARATRIVALAAEGKLNEAARSPFRMVVAGDADFVSNSFFPYLANSDFVLAAIAWLTHEERGPTMKPPVEVLPTVTLTGDQMRGIFILTVLLMPGLIAFAGGAMWWSRR